MPDTESHPTDDVAEPEADVPEAEAPEAEGPEVPEVVTEPEAEAPEASGHPLPEVEYPDKPEGPIAAAIIAGGVGATALGVLTTLAAANETVKDWLEINSDVGPLSGKTVFAVVVWLVAWVVLHVALRTRPYETRRAFVVSMVLVGVGVLGTFPTFFQAFE